MTLSAVRHRAGVTQGAVRGVPISGYSMGHLTGQATCRLSLSTGAARSEPHGVPRGVVRGQQRSRPGGVRVAGAGGVPRVPGARVGSRGAHHTGVDECICGGTGKARAGQGRGKDGAKNGARTSAITVPITAITGTRHTRHTTPGTPDTRHPHLAMYPGYIVTQCRG